MKRTPLAIALVFIGFADGTRVRADDPPPERSLLLRIADETADPSRADAVSAWKALAATDRVATIRAALRSDDPNLVFAAAAVASPWNLDLEELHLVSRGLALHPLARWQPFAAINEVGQAEIIICSADLKTFWLALAERNPAAGDFYYAAPHRMWLPADVPALLPILETAKPVAFRSLLDDVRNMAENEAGDERQADYVRAFRYALARLRAEAGKRPIPKLSDVGPVARSKGGLPAEYVELLRATCGPLGHGFDLGQFSDPKPLPNAPKPPSPSPSPTFSDGPARWLHRWALRLTPTAEDVDFLRELVEMKRVLPQTRWWAARKIAHLSTQPGLAGRAAGHALHQVLVQEDDASLFAVAELASRGRRAEWDLPAPEDKPVGTKRSSMLAMARWLADPVAAREIAWKALAAGDKPEDISEDECWFASYDVGIDVKPEDLAWIAGRMKSEGAPVAAEAWFLANVHSEPLDVKEAERLLTRWSTRVAEVEVLESDLTEALARMEPFAHEAVVEFVRRLATESKDEDVRRGAFGLLVRLGDRALASQLILETNLPTWSFNELLGRVHDPTIEAWLQERAASPDMEVESPAVEALAILYGAPEPLARYFGPLSRNEDDPKADDWDAAKALVLAKDPIGGVLLRTAKGPTMSGGAGQLDFTVGFGLTNDPRVVERLRAWRDERASGLYWISTACLALQGDGAARSEWRAFLGEARTFLLDDLQNGPLFTMNGDSAWVDDWVSRLDANCCYSWHAHSVLKEMFPTFPYVHAPGDAGRCRRAAERWFARHRGTFVWSPILDGWIPGPKR